MTRGNVPDADTYHSALHDETLPEEGLDYHESDGSVVAEQDITDGMLDVFERADAIYTEPAWRPGYEDFIERAGKDVDAGKAFERYMMHTNNVIEALGVPAYLVGGKNNLNWLKPDDIHEVRFELHNTDCYLLMWNGADVPRYEVETVLDAVNYVADEYETVLDFNAGTGRTARVMTERGKSFICTDVNPRCVRYIAEEFLGFEG